MDSLLFSNLSHFHTFRTFAFFLLRPLAVAVIACSGGLVGLLPELASAIASAGVSRFKIRKLSFDPLVLCSPPTKELLSSSASMLNLAIAGGRLVREGLTERSAVSRSACVKPREEKQKLSSDNLPFFLFLFF